MGGWGFGVLGFWGIRGWVLGVRGWVLGVRGWGFGVLVEFFHFPYPLSPIPYLTDN
jgi:hypothetical protein